MSREHIQTPETEVPALQESTVRLEKYGEGVWVDASLKPVVIQLGMTELELYGRDAKTGTIDGVEAPNNVLGVVIQSANPHLSEDERSAVITLPEDGSGALLDIGRNALDGDNFYLDSSVSPQHVAIVADTEEIGRFFIVDTGSENGTTVTSQEVAYDDEFASQHEYYNRSLALTDTVESAALIPEEEVTDITPDTVRGQTEAETAFLQKLLTEIRPVAGITLDSGDYFVSEPMRIAPPYDGEQYSLGLRRDGEGYFNALWFRKDITEEHDKVGASEWKLAPSLTEIAEYDSFKGWTAENKGDYLRPEAYKLDESLAAMLEYLERTDSHELAPEEVVSEYITQLRIDTAKLDTTPDLIEQVEETKITSYGVSVLQTEKGYNIGVGAEDGRAQLEEMVLPDGLEPDFSSGPDRTYTIVHEVLGSTKVEVYEAELEGRPVAWHVASAGVHLWVERLEYTDSATTTAATPQDVILSGALTVRPIEEVGSYGEWGEPGVDWVPIENFPRYGYMLPTIERMPWARHYLQAHRHHEYEKAA